MDDYRNNFKVEKALKTALVRDRARVQFGRISMFGLMELSRQRLRSSLIDKSFERCNYCKGSGLILNSNSISEQIINVIKEKLSNNNNSEISVRCNTILAENLLNLKKNEIILLENNYQSKISFYFDNQFSLHNPSIEIVENVIKNKEENKTKNTNDKKTKKQPTTNKRTNIKSKITKKASAKNNLKLKENKTKEKVEIESKEIIDENVEEKTGWWS